MSKDNRNTRPNNRNPHDQASKARRSSPRCSGKPAAAERAIGPAELAIIAQRHLQHRPIVEIAEELGVVPGTIRHHLEHSIKPSFRHSLMRMAEEEMARIDMVEKIAWERFAASMEPQTKRTIKHGLLDGLKGKPGKIGIVERAMTKIKTNGDIGWINVIQWCVEERCKIKGHYASQRLHINHGGDVRVAGKSREDIDLELQQRIAFLLNNREERARLLENYGGSD